MKWRDVAGYCENSSSINPTVLSNNTATASKRTNLSYHCIFFFFSTSWFSICTLIFLRLFIFDEFLRMYNVHTCHQKNARMIPYYIMMIDLFIHGHMYTLEHARARAHTPALTAYTRIHEYTYFVSNLEKRCIIFVERLIDILYGI